jgi:hypothetical protein
MSERLRWTHSRHERSRSRETMGPVRGGIVPPVSQRSSSSDTNSGFQESLNERERFGEAGMIQDEAK